MAQKTARDGQNKFKKIVIIVIAIILALSMTIPSVGILMARNSGSADDAAQAASEGGALLAASQGYVETFADLKSAWRASETPETYEETLRANYDTWAQELYATFSASGAAGPDEISQAFQVLLDDIADTQSTSADPDSYNANIAFAYYTYAICLRGWEATTGEDVSALLSDCMDKGIPAHQAALDYSYDATLAADLANMYFWNEQTDLAIQTAEEALDVEPENAIVWYYLGNYYLVEENTEKAQECYTNAATFDPDGSLGARDAANQQLVNMGVTPEGAAAEPATEEPAA